MDLFDNENTEQFLKIKLPKEGMWFLRMYKNDGYVQLEIRKLEYVSPPRMTDEPSRVLRQTYWYPQNYSELPDLGMPYHAQTSMQEAPHIMDLIDAGYYLDELPAKGFREVSFKSAKAAAQMTLDAYGFNGSRMPYDSNKTALEIHKRIEIQSKRLEYEWEKWKKGEKTVFEHDLHAQWPSEEYWRNALIGWDTAS